MIIYCKSFETFVNVIAAMVMKGLQFEADAEACTVRLTGGY